MFYIYHHTDADGYGSAAVVMTYLKLTSNFDPWASNTIKLISYNYQELDTFLPMPENDIQNNSEIYIVDLSVSTGTLEKFIQFLEMAFKKKCKVTWIDHHKSSVNPEFKELLDKRFVIYNFEKYVDTNYCAAHNCFVYLIQGKYKNINLPEIIRVIDDYDCWKLKLDGTKEFNVGFGLYNRNLPTNPDWYKWLTNRQDSLTIIKNSIEAGKTINAWLDIDDTNKFNQSAFETTLCGLSCCAINARRNSDIFRTDKSYDILLSYLYNGSNYIYSVYSKNPNVYCNKVAEMFGGGGHQGAAGFTTKKLVVKKNRSLFYRIKDKFRCRKYKKSLS